MSDRIIFLKHPISELTMPYIRNKPGSLNEARPLYLSSQLPRHANLAELHTWSRTNSAHNALRSFSPENSVNMASHRHRCGRTTAIFVLFTRRRRRLAAAGCRHVWERSWIRRREGRGL